MWKIELAQTFIKEAGIFDDLKRVLADRMEITAPDKLRLFDLSSKTKQKTNEDQPSYLGWSSKEATDVGMFRKEMTSDHFEVLTLQKGMSNGDQTQRLLREH